MTDKLEQKRLLTRYLLGQMPAEERTQLEDRYLADPGLFEELTAVEDELIRCYVRGNCTDQEKRELEHRFASSPEWRQKVEFEESLLEHVTSVAASVPSPTPSAGGAVERISSFREPATARTWKWPAAPALRFAAGIIVLAGAAWGIVMNLSLRQELAQMRSQQADLQRREQELRQQVTVLNLKLQESEKQEIARLDHSTISPFILSPRLERSLENGKPLVIPPSVLWVPLQLRLDQDGFSSYDAVLETAGGNQIWQQQNLSSHRTPGGKHVIAVELPSSILRRGTYVLKLTGITPSKHKEEAADYIFRIVRR